MFQSFQPITTEDRAAERSYAFGQRCGEAIELLLCAVERLGPDTPHVDLCVMAEAVIEHMGNRPSEVSWDDVYAGARSVSPRFRKAEVAHEAAVSGRAVA
jgi:hypothetical protein